jgi:RNA polymerase sigma factor (sigma-70 family)
VSDENELYEEWRAATDRQDVEQRLYSAVSRHATAVVLEKFPEGHRELPHDIASAVIGRLGKFRQGSKFSTWVHAIAVRKTDEALRKLVRKKKIFDETKVVVADAGEKTEQEDGDEEEMRNRVSAVTRPDFDSSIALDQLSNHLPEEDAALVRYKREGLTSAEIATRLGTTQEAVESRWERLKSRQKKKKVSRPRRL